MGGQVGVKLLLLYFRWTCFFFGRVAADDILPSALSRSDFVRSVQVGRSRFSRAFGVVLNFCSRTVLPCSSHTPYQLDRSPRSSPTVNFCREIFVLRCAATVLTFFIAGLLFICALSTSITWERTPHPVRRPAFSLENNCGNRWVKQLPSALELPCARVVGAASPSTASGRRSGCDRSTFRQDPRSCSGSSASDSQ